MTGQVLFSIVLLGLIGLSTQQACQSVIDICFVVDESGSICDDYFNADPSRPRDTCPNWEFVRGFLLDAVNQLGVSQDGVRMGLVTFRGDVKLVFDLTQPDPSGIIRGYSYTAGGTTNTPEALRIGRTQCFNAEGDRPDVNNVMIVITDGKPSDRWGGVPDTCNEALITQNDNIKVLGVGITDSVANDTMRCLASEPKEFNSDWFVAAEFSKLTEVLEQLVTSACKTECSNDADVLFIVDVSGSIGSSRFEQMRQAMLRIVEEFGVTNPNSPRDTRVAVVSFSDNANEICGLSSGSDIVTCINAVRYTRGRTNTAAALDMAVNTVFAPGRGDRANVVNVAVVLTDGGSNNKQSTIAAAIRAKQNINIFTVGIGNWLDEYELKAIASDPWRSNYIRVSFDDLQAPRTITTIRDYVCNNQNECARNPCLNGGVCINLPGGYVCRCPSNRSGPNCEFSCRQPAYVGILLDESGSIGKDNFLTMTAFARNLVKQLPVGAGAGVSLATFDTTVRGMFNFGDYNTVDGVIGGMTLPFYNGGTTNTAGAINYLVDTMFSPANTPNTNLPKVGIVITDGRSNDPKATRAAARRARDAGIYMIAIGIGSQFEKSRELETIASEPTNANVFTVGDFNGLEDVVGNIREAMCNDIDHCSPNPCRNGGICTDIGMGFSCACPSRFTGSTCERSCQGEERDITIVLDRSGSIRRERFDEVKSIIAKFINQMEIRDRKVRVAAVAFSDTAEVLFDFNQFSRAQDIIDELYAVEWRGGRTNIASALELACNELFNSARGDRADADNQIVLFSDGAANLRVEDTVPAAITCKARGARITVNGIGSNLNMREMAAIASGPSLSGIATISSYTDLEKLWPMMVSQLCNDVDECASNPCQFGGTCINGYDNYFCVCTEGRTGRNCERGQCNPQNDIVFILDISGSVNPVCSLGMRGIAEIIYGLDFRNENTRAALVTFDDTVRTLFGLDRFNTKRNYLMALACYGTGGKTNTADALQYVRTNILTGTNGDRFNVPNKVVVVTDGGSNVNADRTNEEARLLKANAEVFVVSATSKFNTNEINQIASSADNVYNIVDEDTAFSVGQRFLNRICSP